jgi:hypothetical protein
VYCVCCLQTFHYIEVYNQILEYELPALAAHFQEIGIDAQMYAVDWYAALAIHHSMLVN